MDDERRTMVASVEAGLEPEAYAEIDRVVAWRAQSLMRAGYEDVVALELALRRDVDLHRAIALLEAGCPPETAVRILL